MRARLALITPPVLKPCEPGLSAAAATSAFLARGVSTFGVDASQGWFSHTLSEPNLQAALALAEASNRKESTLKAYRLAFRAVAEGRSALKQSATYRDRRVYSSAVSHLVNALKLASEAHPGFHLRISDVEAEGLRPHSSADLEGLARTPGPFDAYYRKVLLPRLRAEGTTHVGLSLTFLHQAYATFRLAALLEEELPQAQRWLAGPLLDCWASVGADLGADVFRRFHRVLPSTEPADLDALALELGAGKGSVPSAQPERLAPPLGDVLWEAYLSPQPVVPLALGRGCYWRRCAFCPDFLHPHYRPSERSALAEWLEQVAQRFPGGAMLHLTDSALPPALLAHVASVIQERQLPLRWHGFARLEARFAEGGFAERLARGGCVLLQWGLETASPRLLSLTDKGVPPEQARAVLRATSGAGIANHAYLLFGLPTETEVDRQLTLEFVREESEHLHDLNLSLLNLPRRSPMHLRPHDFGITTLQPFGQDTDLSLYLDFRCGDSHPRLEARRWIQQIFLKDPDVKRLLGDLNAPFQANHGCFLAGKKRKTCGNGPDHG